jgi:hypothetical protein
VHRHFQPALSQLHIALTAIQYFGQLTFYAVKLAVLFDCQSFEKSHNIRKIPFELHFKRHKKQRLMRAENGYRFAIGEILFEFQFSENTVRDSAVD